MKKIYELPELNVSMFEESNILTTGSGNVKPEDSFDYSGGERTVKMSWVDMISNVQIVP